MNCLGDELSEYMCWGKVVEGPVVRELFDLLKFYRLSVCYASLSDISNPTFSHLYILSGGTSFCFLMIFEMAGTASEGNVRRRQHR